MITLIVGTVILALTYGVFWHQQPARRQNDDDEDHPFPLGHFVNRALEWLVLMRRLPSSAASQARVLVSQQSAIPEGQTEILRPVLGNVRGWNPERIPVERAAAEPSVPAGLFNIEGEHA
jgi:hypothetical protein